MNQAVERAGLWTRVKARTVDTASKTKNFAKNEWGVFKQIQDLSSKEAQETPFFDRVQKLHELQQKHAITQSDAKIPWYKEPFDYVKKGIRETLLGPNVEEVLKKEGYTIDKYKQTTDLSPEQHKRIFDTCKFERYKNLYAVAGGALISLFSAASSGPMALVNLFAQTLAFSKFSKLEKHEFFTNHPHVGGILGLVSTFAIPGLTTWVTNLLTGLVKRLFGFGKKDEARRAMMMQQAMMQQAMMSRGGLTTMPPQGQFAPAYSYYS